MCNLYTVPGSTDAMIRKLLRGDPPAWWPAEPSELLNAYARPTVPILLNDGSVVQAEWTYMPPAPKTMDPAEQKKQNEWRKQTYNTVAEEAFVKQTWKDAIRQRRCLVPAASYSEHQHRDGGKVKVMYRFTRYDQAAFVFLGVWKTWDDGVTRFSILTTKPNKLNRFIHNSKPRQPVWSLGDEAFRYLEGKDEKTVEPFIIPRDDDGFGATIAPSLVGKLQVDLPPPPEFDDSPLQMPVMVLKQP